MNDQDAGKRLRDAREGRGMTAAELAEAAGLSPETYYDLEDFEDLYLTVSLSEICRLCEHLNIRPLSLFAPEAAESLIALDFGNLQSEVRRHIVQNHLTVEAFEERAGWELREFLSDSSRAWEWNIDCLRDVCGEVGIDWRRVVKSCRQ